MIQKDLKAVILAGGKGTRLYPITYEIPKPLLPVKQKPIINHLVELFSEQGIKDIFVLINKEFKEEFDWWKKRYYPSTGASTELSRKSSGQALKIKLVEETKPLGTFGGLYYLKKELSGKEFFLTNGDELKKINLKKMIDFYQKRKEPAALALVKVNNPQDYGVVVTENGTVKEFLEKPKNPPTNYINSGLYLLNDEVFNYHPGPKFCMVETELFPKLAQEGKLAGFKFQGKWMDCGNFERYSKALKYWR